MFKKTQLITLIIFVLCINMYAGLSEILKTTLRQHPWLTAITVAGPIVGWGCYLLKNSQGVSIVRSPHDSISANDFNYLRQYGRVSDSIDQNNVNTKLTIGPQISYILPGACLISVGVLTMVGLVKLGRYLQEAHSN